MFVYHVGRPGLLIDNLVAAERLLGIGVELPLELDKPNLLSKQINRLKFKPGAILHLHFSSFGELADISRDLNKLKSQNVKIVAQVYGDLSSTKNSKPKDSSIFSNLDHLFLSSPELLDLIHKEISWSWLQAAMPVRNDISPCELSKEDIIRLLIPVDLYESFKAELEKLKSNQKLEIEIYNKDTLAELSSKIDSFHIIIDQLNTVSYGIASLIAMAAARTTLCSYTDQHLIWELLKFTQVVPVTNDNLIKKLEGIIKEPKTIRDFGKRGQAFILQKHNPESVARIAISRYQALE